MRLTHKRKPARDRGEWKSVRKTIEIYAQKYKRRMKPTEKTEKCKYYLWRTQTTNRCKLDGFWLWIYSTNIENMQNIQMHNSMCSVNDNRWRCRKLNRLHIYSYRDFGFSKRDKINDFLHFTETVSKLNYLLIYIYELS